MTIEHADLFAALARPFHPHEVKVRQQAGRQLHYITARTAMNRLDEVLGPSNWWDEYLPSEHSVLCKLTICLPDGKVLTKCDAGGYAGMSDQGDDDKSGYSDAFKRTCVKFGVGRYLYRDGVPEFVRNAVSAAESPEVMATADPGPRQATPGAPQPGPRHREPASRPPGGPRNGGGGGGGGNRGTVLSPPRSGRALFAWVKDQEQRNEVGLLQYMNKWGKLQDFPSRMVDWDADMVARAHQEANRKIRASAPDANDAQEEANACEDDDPDSPEQEAYYTRQAEREGGPRPAPSGRSGR